VQASRSGTSSKSHPPASRRRAQPRILLRPGKDRRGDSRNPGHLPEPTGTQQDYSERFRLRARFDSCSSRCLPAWAHRPRRAASHHREAPLSKDPVPTTRRLLLPDSEQSLPPRLDLQLGSPRAGRGPTSRTFFFSARTSATIQRGTPTATRSDDFVLPLRIHAPLRNGDTLSPEHGPASPSSIDPKHNGTTTTPSKKCELPLRTSPPCPVSGATCRSRQRRTTRGLSRSRRLSHATSRTRSTTKPSLAAPAPRFLRDPSAIIFGLVTYARTLPGDHAGARTRPPRQRPREIAISGEPTEKLTANHSPISRRQTPRACGLRPAGRRDGCPPSGRLRLTPAAGPGSSSAPLIKRSQSPSAKDKFNSTYPSPTSPLRTYVLIRTAEFSPPGSGSRSRPTPSTTSGYRVPGSCRRHPAAGEGSSSSSA